jgi:outer membrane protein
MKNITLSISALLVCIATLATAQSNTSVTYSMGFGTGDLGNYIEKPSFRGFTIDYRKLVNTNVGIGVSGGWNVFYEEKPYDVYTAGTESLAGKQYRYSNHWPMLLSADYYFSPGEKISPFVGLGTGVIYTLRNTDMGIWTLEQDAWNFALQPQIGVQFNHSIMSGTTIMLKYYNGFAAGDLEEAQSYLALNIGFVFRQP